MIQTPHVNVSNLLLSSDATFASLYSDFSQHEQWFHGKKMFSLSLPTSLSSLKVWQLYVWPSCSVTVRIESWGMQYWLKSLTAQKHTPFVASFYIHCGTVPRVWFTHHICICAFVIICITHDDLPILKISNLSDPSIMIFQYTAVHLCMPIYHLRMTELLQFFSPSWYKT